MSIKPDVPIYRIEPDGSTTIVTPQELKRGDLIDVGDGPEKVVAVDLEASPVNLYTCSPDCKNPLAPALMGGVIGLPRRLW